MPQLRAVRRNAVRIQICHSVPAPGTALVKLFTQRGPCFYGHIYGTHGGINQVKSLRYLRKGQHTARKPAAEGGKNLLCIQRLGPLQAEQGMKIVCDGVRQGPI